MYGNNWSCYLNLLVKVEVVSEYTSPEVGVGGLEPGAVSLD